MKDLLREPQLIDFWQTAACRSESCHGHVSVRWPEHLELKLNATRCVLADGREIGRALLFCDVTSDRSVRMELTEEVAHRLLDLAGSTAGPPAAVAQLTPQELRVLKLVGQGLGNRAIAEALCVAESTVRSHVKGFYRKLGIHTRAAAVRFAASEHLS